MTTAVAPPVDVLRPGPTAPTAGSAATRAQIERSASEFEAAFLSSMLNTLFQGVQAPDPFGGGSGEETFRSFLNEAFSRTMTRAGGVGLSDAVAREMLTLQGLERA